MSRLTLWGMYQYNKNLFSEMALPQGILHDALVNRIMRRSGDLYTYYQSPSILKENIKWWSMERLPEWERMLSALYADYNPIENYDRTESRKRNTESESKGKDLTSSKGNEVGKEKTSESTSNNGSDVLKVSAYNDTDFANREQNITENGTSSEAERSLDRNTSAENNRTNEETQTHKENEEVRTHGNIGVTTSQQMIVSEMELRAKYPFYNILAREFEHEFLVEVY